MPHSQITPLRQSRNNCRSCRLATLCLPDTLEEEDVNQLDSIILRRRPIERGETLFHAGSKFNAIYAVRTGALKTFTVLPCGDEHIAGFHLPGELIGLDAISTQTYPSTAVALETTTVCEVPFSALERLIVSNPVLQRHLVRIMSRELYAEQGMSIALARRSAEQRLAAILLSLSERFANRGLSRQRFRLPMSRHELGNYLGLVPETMSRTFRRLETQNLVHTEGKEISLIDLEGLAVLAHGPGAGISRTGRA